VRTLVRPIIKTKHEIIQSATLSNVMSKMTAKTAETEWLPYHHSGHVFNAAASP